MKRLFGAALAVALLALAPAAFARAGGGCFTGDAPVLMADGTQKSIASVAVGDLVLSASSDGKTVPSKVVSIYSLAADEVIVVAAGGASFRVTPDHPFAAAAGAFRRIDQFKVGDSLLAYRGGAFESVRIDSMRVERGAKTVYNLSVEAPNTFIAAGVLVHNKGGGCFAGDTPVLLADGSSRPISAIAAGDLILAGEAGRGVPARVMSIYSLPAEEILVVGAGGASFRVTPDHPFADPAGAFKRIDQFRVGDSLLAYRGGGFAAVRIDSIRSEKGTTTVYNLSVASPNTFVAAGILVHNKGGGFGGFGGGSRSSGGGGSWGGGLGGIWFFGPGSGGIIAVIVIIIIIGAIVSWASKKYQSGGWKSGPGKAPEGDDYTSTDEIILRQERARKFEENALAVAAMAAPNYPEFEAELLKRVANDVFLRTQQAWMQRDIEALRPIFSAGLLARHGALIRAMARAHEVNVLAGLRVDGLWIVNVRNLPTERSFSALVQATATDYYVDDRTRSYIRGDDSPTTFQEIWIFERAAAGEANQGVEGWRLKEIVQSDEAADVLRRENATEDESQMKIQATSRTVAEGDEKKGQRVEELTRLDELLGGLAKSDPAWNADKLRERAAELFTKVYMARQSGDRYELEAGDITPEILRVLIAEFDGRSREGVTVEYANFCVRTVDVVLVRNYKDNSRDEFMAKIAAHARIIVRRSGRVESDQGEAKRFVEHWCFRRGPVSWMVSEIDATPRRDDESFDEEDVPW